ncbi:MAG: YMGG-like glycine zipper-containing protein [Pyrinomonadaceae bacterium]
MYLVRKILTTALACSLTCLAPATSAQQRRTAPKPTPRRTTKPAPRTATATKTAPATNPATTAADARLTGLYRLDERASADPAQIARRVAASLPPDAQRDVLDDLAARLNSPPQIAIQRRGRTFDIASTRSPRISFDADGQTYTEQAADGHTVHTRAAVYGDSLMISSRGSADDEFSVNFDAVEAGRRLRVTRRIYEPRLNQPVVVQSVYERVSQVARFNIYGEPVPAATGERARNNEPPRAEQPQPQPRWTPPADARVSPAQQPPVIRPRVPPPAPADAGDTSFRIGENTSFVGTLNEDLDTEHTRVGDPFTLTVRAPAAFAGATIEGRVARLDRGGPFAGRAGMTLEFTRIVLPDGRAADFAGNIEDVRPAGGDNVRVDNEARGNVESGTSQSDRTMERAAIGAAVGALIGAIAGGGKGAAIGAGVGAGAGVGSVYAQGRDDLSLPRGTEITLRSTRR